MVDENHTLGHFSHSQYANHHNYGDNPCRIHFCLVKYIRTICDSFWDGGSTDLPTQKGGRNHNIILYMLNAHRK